MHDNQRALKKPLTVRYAI